MNLSLLTYTVLAQISRWRRLGDGLHRGRGRVEMEDLWPWVIGAAVVGIGAAIAVAIARRNDFSQSSDDRHKLFRELCRAHQLDAASQRLLRQLADAFQLEHPAAIFLSPGAFRPEAVPEHLRSRQRRIDQLRNRLF